jgi:hypothetical protein
MGQNTSRLMKKSLEVKRVIDRYFNFTAYVTASSLVRALVIASRQARYAGDDAVPPS